MDTNIANFLKAFFCPILGIGFNLWSRFRSLLSLAPPSPAPPSQPPPPPSTSTVSEARNLDWTMIMIAFCLAAAVEIAIQAVQFESQVVLPLTFHLLSLSILFAFTCLFVSTYMTNSTRLTFIAQMLERAGVFFVFTAFFLAISIPFPLWLKFTTWFIYFISLITLFVCNLII